LFTKFIRFKYEINQFNQTKLDEYRVVNRFDCRDLIN